MGKIQNILNTIKSLPIKETNPHSFTIPDPSKFDESKIIMDYSVIEKWHQGWKRNLDSINEAVIHHTGA